MTAAVQNILTLADRDLAAGRYADAEREYAKVLEEDADLYVAVHGRGVARTCQSTMLSGDPVALITSTEEAFRMCEKQGGDKQELLTRVTLDIINFTAKKYNELTRIYNSVARKENTKAPSRLFFYTWSVSKPEGLALSDIYIPLINYLAAIIRVSEYLDGILEGNEELKSRRLHNVGNLAIYYDWLISFNATGRVSEEYYQQVREKKNYLSTLRAELEGEMAAPTEFKNAPFKRPEGRPLPGIANQVDEDKKIARFPLRAPFELICPLCGTIQNSNRNVCFQCGAKFFFDDEAE